MVHRKFKHESPICKKLLENKCTFNADTCWFKHSASNDNQDFQLASVKAKPPLSNHLEQNQLLLQTMLKTMEELRDFIKKKE